MIPNYVINCFKISMPVIAVSLVFIGLCRAHDEGGMVKTYSQENFPTTLVKKHNFIMFFAPWCSHCKRLAPVWEDLAKEINSNDKSDLVIGKVDCTVDVQVCSEQEITGYPTLKLYKAGTEEGIKYRGSRDIPSLKKFIIEQIENVDEILSSEKSADLEVVVDLTDETFEDHVSKGNHFVKFFAPWCSHCQMLAPKWHELAESLKDNNDVTVSKIDCTKSQKICNVYDVLSYPTLIWIQDGKKVGIYQGSRSIDDLKDYVTQMLHPVDFKNAEEKIPSTLETEKHVITLTEDNFQPNIDKGYTFIKFFAPWCGHCKRLAPTWEQLAQQLAKEGGVKVAHVDCTVEENKELCNNQEVEGYPTLYLYRNGVKISEYNGSRTLEDLVEFVNRHTSTHDEL